MTANFNETLELLKQFSPDDLIAMFRLAFSDNAPGAPVAERCNCPYCSGSNVILFGKKRGKQRYFCKECSRTFVPTTNTVMSMSHYSKDIWEAMLQDTIDGNSLSYSEKKLGISHQAAFNMRHKILLALQDISKDMPVVLGDVSELDETFVLDCYKGKALPDSVDREARKHGSKAQKRGISNEYICICTGVQRKSEPVIQSVNRAKPSCDELAEVFSGHISNGALLLTDGLRSYSILETIADCSVKNVETEAASFYNLNTVNNLHAFIKKQYVFYRGVATKYLNRYCTLFSVAYRKTADILRQIESRLFTVGSMCHAPSLYDIRNCDLLML